MQQCNVLHFKALSYVRVSNHFQEKSHNHNRNRMRPARVTTTVSVFPNLLNYCAIFMPYVQFTNVAAGRITQPGRPRVEDPCPRSGLANKRLTVA
jgi:hypothetical protein